MAESQPSNRRGNLQLDLGRLHIDGSLPFDGLRLVVEDTKELLDLKSEVAVNDLIDITALRQVQAELGLKPK